MMEQRELCFETVPANDMLALLVQEGFSIIEQTLRDKTLNDSPHIRQILPEELPRNWLTLDSYDLIFIHSVVLGKLDDQQLEALTLWTLQGKKLVFLKGRHSDPLPDLFSATLSKSAFVEYSLLTENESKSKLQGYSPRLGPLEPSDPSRGDEYTIPRLSRTISLQRAFLGNGEIILILWEDSTDRIVDLVFKIAKSELLSIGHPEGQLTAKEIRAIASELDASLVNESKYPILPGLLLGYSVVVYFFWIFVTPRLSQRPVLLIAMIFLLSWTATIFVLKHNIILGYRGGPVSTRTLQLIRIFPQNQYALVEKFLSLRSSGRGRGPDLYFRYPGNLRDISSSRERHPGYTLVGKETRPGFTIPSHEWYYGQKELFFWEGFLPKEYILDLALENKQGTVSGLLQNRLPQTIHDVYLYQAAEKRMWYYKLINPGQTLQLSQGKEIDSLLDTNLPSNAAWQKTALNRLFLFTNAEFVLLGWTDN